MSSSTPSAHCPSTTTKTGTTRLRNALQSGRRMSRWVSSGLEGSSTRWGHSSTIYRFHSCGTAWRAAPTGRRRTRHRGRRVSTYRQTPHPERPWPRLEARSDTRRRGRGVRGSCTPEHPSLRWRSVAGPGPHPPRVARRKRAIAPSLGWLRLAVGDTSGLLVATDASRIQLVEPDITLASRVVSALSVGSPGHGGWAVYWSAFTYSSMTFDRELRTLSAEEREFARGLARDRLNMLISALPRASARPAFPRAQTSRVDPDLARARRRVAALLGRPVAGEPGRPARTGHPRLDPLPVHRRHGARVAHLARQLGHRPGTPGPPRQRRDPARLIPGLRHQPGSVPGRPGVAAGAAAADAGRLG